MKTISPIINASELLKIYQNNNFLIIDARSGTNAKSTYETEHLEGALFLNLETQLAKIEDNAAIGGRHPLPKITAFLNTIADCGISTKSHIVIYDDKNGANDAARLWWMLKAVGLENVQVLNGGIQSALKINFPTSSNIEKTTKVAALKITNWTLPMATIEEVEENSTKSNYIVIDVRETARYNGDIEPIDLVAGHIPSAINIPLAENLDENGLFLPPSILKEKYGKLADTTENVIIHCGSGVTACHTLLAFAYAGLKIPKLYVGSWSEWSRNNKPVATK